MTPMPATARSPYLRALLCRARTVARVAWLIEKQGDAKLTDLLVKLADCSTARSVSIHDRCKTC